jgi:putative ABC transport system permease protein
LQQTLVAAASDVDADAALYNPRPLNQIRDEALANDEVTVTLLASFAGLGLLLAAVGIYGVMAFSVAQRSNEIALRMALGAPRAGIAAMVVKEGAMLACVGSGLGLIGACLVGRAMQSLLFGMARIDVTTLSVVAMALLVASLFACCLPALRGAKVEIMEALKAE